MRCDDAPITPMPDGAISLRRDQRRIKTNRNVLNIR